MHVSVCTVHMMSVLPHTRELRHHTAAAGGWVTTPVAVAAQESWLLGKRSLLSKPAAWACEETHNCLCRMFFLCGDKSPFSCCGIYKTLCAQGPAGPGLDPAHRGQWGSRPLPSGAPTCPAACHASAWPTWGARGSPTACPVPLHPRSDRSGPSLSPSHRGLLRGHGARQGFAASPKPPSPWGCSGVTPFCS